MMKFSGVVSVAMAGLLSLAFVGPIFAQDGAMLQGADAIAKRIELMKANGGMMRTLGSLTGDEAVTAGQALVDNYAAMGNLWPEDSQTGATRAKSEIWTDTAGFETAMMNSAAAAAAILAAAQAGDNAAYVAATKTLGATCGACHDAYRGPKI